MKKPVCQRVASAMEIPADIAGHATLVELTGQNAVRVENYLGILEYTQDRLFLQCRDCRLEILGSHLVVEAYTKQEMTLSGRIEQVHYF